MKKLRKMLCDLQDPHIQTFMRLMETQSKITLANWGIAYAQQHILPIYEKAYPGDDRPLHALLAAQDWLDGKIKLPEAKKIILNECHAAAREAEATPAAQAAARTCGQAASAIHTPTHALGLVFYGTAAIVYDRAGTEQSPAVYSEMAAEECRKMEASLHAVAIENEPNPAKLNWNC